jgi:hypothetical protein
MNSMKNRRAKSNQECPPMRRIAACPQMHNETVDDLKIPHFNRS